ncbi:NAD-dependent epimerase/dehydratase family protein [Nocardioides sp. zg-DK7169]|uniref:NAD-dependent epimerase/dehydratase family protein n=1 Tax=Nocardioides sp. zg-DK7169 TaxID=2736600 RepID=UPI00155756BD|nr:NAD-dependent epimerase/dehydratase family protein [Nocardioides sp. zg-DK7169]NPC97109.1 NAD-dependent epimerase/dehydratase family protein [Nocardioides sp. zg-DK7169]
MDVLVLGGTRFVSRAVAQEAVERGHRVTCANRGLSGTVPAGARHLVLDRDRPLPDLGSPDAVVDVARQPSWVRRSVAALPHAHQVFVSSISAYADETTPHGTPETLPLHEPRFDDVDLSADAEAYGPLKVACEQLVRDGAASWTILRPGLVVGPGDPTGRFSYWPARLAATPTRPEVLAPGTPEDPVQVIDVRDLARWIVRCAEERVGGVYDAVGPAVPLGVLLGEVAAGCGVPDPLLTWVDQGSLERVGVSPWAGPHSLPLWLPRPAYDGMMTHDAAPALAAGLVLRPLAEIGLDTLTWLRATPDAVTTGLTAEEEAGVLRLTR